MLSVEDQVEQDRTKRKPGEHEKPEAIRHISTYILTYFLSRS